MDMRKIRKLIELIQETGVAEIEIREGDVSVRITREIAKVTQAMAAPAVMPTVIPTTQTAQAAHDPARAATENSALGTADAAAAAKHTVKAPMVGTVYFPPPLAPKHLWKLAKQLKLGDMLCLIEAMKMFNQIEADKAGTITAIFVENGIPVEFNQPLFVIE